MPNEDGDMHRPPTPVTITDDFNYIADDVGSDSGQSESSTGTVLGPGIQPLEGTPTTRVRSTLRELLATQEESTGSEAWELPATQTSALLRPANMRVTMSNSESSYNMAGSQYGGASSRGYGADDASSEYESTLCGSDISWQKARNPGFQADLTGVENESTNNYPDPYAMQDFLEDAKKHLVAITDDVITTGGTHPKIPVWLGAIKLYLNEFQRHFAALESMFPACKATSQQYASGAISTPAIAGLATDKPYKVLTSY